MSEHCQVLPLAASEDIKLVWHISTRSTCEVARLSIQRIPRAGAGVTRLRREILGSSFAKEGGITALTVHDLMVAVLWLAR